MNKEQLELMKEINKMLHCKVGGINCPVCNTPKDFTVSDSDYEELIECGKCHLIDKVENWHNDEKIIIRHEKEKLNDILDEGWCLRWLMKQENYHSVSIGTEELNYHTMKFVGTRCIEDDIFIPIEFDDLLTALLRLVLTVMKEGK